jgi:hypothetical protein
MLNVGEGSFLVDGWDGAETTGLNFGLRAGFEHVRLSSKSQEVHDNKLLECSLDGPVAMEREFVHGEDLHM